ncbi:MAG: hypothetical protein KatS3mg082_1808 [Nitrospiraceae bacterium]|nr:MAG: hypothetical protein KatS3mg082_1808 [Nitrospiraceae bacterium]
MASYSDFFDYVRPSVPQAPIPLLTHHVREAVIDFCRATKLYRSEASIDSVAGTAQYTFGLPPNTDLVDVLSAAYENRPLDPASPNELDGFIPKWRTEQGMVEFYFLPTPATPTIRLVRIPDESVTGAIHVTAAVAPTRASTDCPDWLLARYSNTVADGALGALLKIREEPWYDPERALYHERLFMIALGAGNAQAGRGNTRAPLRTRTVARIE